MLLVKTFLEAKGFPIIVSMIVTWIYSNAFQIAVFCIKFGAIKLTHSKVDNIEGIFGPSQLKFQDWLHFV